MRVWHHTCAGADRKAGGVVNMVVTVAGVGRRLHLRGLAAGGVRRLLGVTVPGQKSRGCCCITCRSTYGLGGKDLGTDAPRYPHSTPLTRREIEAVADYI